MFYAVAFLLLLLSVIALYAVRSAGPLKLAARSGFLISLLLYLLSYVAAPGAWLYKLLLILPRDAMIFTLLLLAVHKFAPRPRFVFTTLTGLVLLVFYWFFGPLSRTFTVEPDGTYELLADAKTGYEEEALRVTVNWFDGAIKPAFPEIGHPGETYLDDYFLIDIPSHYGFMYGFIRRILQGNPLYDDVEFNDAVAVIRPWHSEPLVSAAHAAEGDPLMNGQWALKALNATATASLLSHAGPQKKTPLLAILDTGVDGAHEDLEGRVSGDDRDVMGHGTHVAGIAAALTGNGRGIASLVPTGLRVNVLSVKVLDDNGSGTEASIINGVVKAADAGADVISMSLGGRSRDSYQRAMEEAVAYAARRGTITVAAAGNESDDARRHVPANAAGLIAVSAVDSLLGKANFSNSVEFIGMGIAAPGVGILSTYPGNQYRVFSGTSMATPYAASVLLLAKAYQPELTARDAWRLLVRTGRDTGNLPQTGAFIQPVEFLSTLLNVQK